MQRSAIDVLFIVKKNQVTMMKTRGFDVTDEEKLFNFTLKEFIDYYTDIMKRDNLTFRRSLNNLYRLYDKDGNVKDSQYVYYTDTVSDKKQLCTPQIFEVIKFITSFEEIRKIVIISEQSIHNQAESSLRKVSNKRFQHYLYRDLLINPFDNKVTPKQRILTDEEIKEIFPDITGDEFGVRTSKLPKTFQDDPVAKFLWAEPGDILIIERKSLFVETLVDNTYAFSLVIKKTLSGKELL